MGDVERVLALGKLMELDRGEFKVWLERQLVEFENDLKKDRQWEQKELQWEIKEEAILCGKRSAVEIAERDKWRAKRAAQVAQLQTEICRTEEMIRLLEADEQAPQRVESLAQVEPGREEDLPKGKVIEALQSASRARCPHEREALNAPQSGSCAGQRPDAKRERPPMGAGSFPHPAEETETRDAAMTPEVYYSCLGPERVVTTDTRGKETRATAGWQGDLSSSKTYTKPRKRRPKHKKGTKAETLPPRFVERVEPQSDVKTPMAKRNAPDRDLCMATEEDKAKGDNPENPDAKTPQTDGPTEDDDQEFSRKGHHGRSVDKGSRPNPGLGLDDDKDGPGLRTAQRTAVDRAVNCGAVVDDEEHGGSVGKSPKGRSADSMEDASTSQRETWSARPSQDRYLFRASCCRGGDLSKRKSPSGKSSDVDCTEAQSSITQPTEHRKATRKKKAEDERRYFEAGTATSPTVKPMGHGKAMSRKRLTKMTTLSWAKRRPRLGG